MQYSYPPHPKKKNISSCQLKNPMYFIGASVTRTQAHLTRCLYQLTDALGEFAANFSSRYLQETLYRTFSLKYLEAKA